MDAVLTKVLRRYNYDPKIFGGSVVAVILLASQQQRLSASLQVLQRALMRYPFIARLQHFFAALPPAPDVVAKWDIRVLGMLAVPVLASIAHSFLPQEIPESERLAQQKETTKRFKTLIEMTDKCFGENETLLKGLLERGEQAEEGGFKVPGKPSKTDCVMPKYRPLEDRFRCHEILSQAQKAFECKPDDIAVTHALVSHDNDKHTHLHTTQHTHTFV